MDYSNNCFTKIETSLILIVIIIIITMNDPVQLEINKTNIKEGLRTDPLDENKSNDC